MMFCILDSSRLCDLGLGSKPEMPTMDNELRNWNRVYVNNLPKDMTEEEIGISNYV